MSQVSQARQGLTAHAQDSSNQRVARDVTRARDQTDGGRRLDRIRAVRSRKQITCQSATDRLLI